MNKKNTNKTINKIKYPIYMTADTHVHIADGNKKVGKGIYCINLLAGDQPLILNNGQQLTNIIGTCGGCCEHCKEKCYAIKNQKFRNSNIPQWAENTILAREDVNLFFDEIQNFLNKSFISAIRFHAFGEIPSKTYLNKMIELAKNNPYVQFYTYTKRYSWVEDTLKEKELPTNLSILISIWHKNYDNPYNLPEFIFDDHSDPELQKIPHCPAVDEHGHETGITCASCKKCVYAKKGDKIAVYEH